MRQKAGWLVLVIMIVALFLSSSMTYKQQTLVPTLAPLFGRHLPAWLAHVDFWWAPDQHISTAVDGPAPVVEFFLRKAAHFGSYLIIGGALMVALQQAVAPMWLRGGLTFFSSTGLAAFDEFHQSFTSGRSPLFQDVMLDASGAAVGLLLVALVQWQLARRRRRRRRGK